MNRIFKVIFSKALGTHVVAGETAKNHGKKSLKAVAAVAMMAGAMGVAGNAVGATYELSGPITSQSDANTVNSKFKDYDEISYTVQVFNPSEDITLDGQNSDPNATKPSVTFTNKDNSNINKVVKNNFTLSFKNFDTLTFQNTHKTDVENRFDGGTRRTLFGDDGNAKGYGYSIIIGEEGSRINTVNFAPTESYFVNFSNAKSAQFNIYANTINFGRGEADADRGVYGIRNAVGGITLNAEKINIYTLGAGIFSSKSTVNMTARNVRIPGKST